MILLTALSLFPPSLTIEPTTLKERISLQKQGYQSYENLYIHPSFFYPTTTADYLKTHTLSPTSYRLIYQPVFDHYYYIDNDPEDTLKTVLNQGGEYEWVQNILIRELTLPNTLAIDIGSHIGVHTITMSRKASTVIAFEPHPQLYMELLYNLKINNCTNVIPISKALGATPQTAHLKKIKIEEDGIPIEVVTLDSYNLTNLSFIKLDVENYEYNVLLGARDTILRNKPAILFECFIDCDFDDITKRDQQANFTRTMNLLDAYGYYTLYNCDFVALPKNTPTKLHKIDPENYNPHQDFQYPRQFDQFFKN
jgi:FkbM family methyltransferase